jgi:hypothetical protein
MPLLVALIAALVYLLPYPKAAQAADARVRELARLTFLAAVIWTVNELATGRPVRLW